MEFGKNVILLKHNSYKGNSHKKNDLCLCLSALQESILVMLVKFETTRKMYIEVTRYLPQTFIYTKKSAWIAISSIIIPKR